ncbi:MAG: hypothetical protein M3N30_10735 [Bacteroidota bacterium]|nr:hypothetical protein [Bacteroidota bacterium]
MFFLPACSTGYKPIEKNIQLGNNSADFFLSSARGKDTVHLYLNLNLQSASPADLQISITNADKDSMGYKLLKIKGPAKSGGMKVEHWAYYFYAAPVRHFSRYVRFT